MVGVSGERLQTGHDEFSKWKIGQMVNRDPISGVYLIHSFLLGQCYSRTESLVFTPRSFFQSQTLLDSILGPLNSDLVMKQDDLKCIQILGTSDIQVGIVVASV